MIEVTIGIIVALLIYSIGIRKHVPVPVPVPVPEKFTNHWTAADDIY